MIFWLFFELNFLFFRPSAVAGSPLCGALDNLYNVLHYKASSGKVRRTPVKSSELR